MFINIYDTCLINYNRNEYWVLAPMNEVLALSKNWNFLRLSTLSIAQLNNIGKIEKEERWFNSNEIKAISSFSITELNSQELTVLRNSEIFINDQDKYSAGEKIW